MRVTIFGLGEAGSHIAADLAAVPGLEVAGYDPADVGTPPKVTRHDTPAAAVRGSRLVLAITAASDAQKAIAQAWNEMKRGTVYADLSTAPPMFKEDLADTAALRGLAFVDVALMGTVPGNGLATPALASGPGAQAFADLVEPWGGRVEVVSEHPGDAAARKLLRSVVTKGLTSLLIESMAAADAHGSGDWLWPYIQRELTDLDARLLHRLISGTPLHVDRRIVEMESAAAFLEALDVEPLMTRATTESLRRVRRDGIEATIERIGEM